MANKSYYHRSFIILKSESKGYELASGKSPTGYCKFEIRRGVGKAHIFTQDMKPSSALDGIYEAYLVSADESIKPCKLANIHVDEQGRGEHVANFDSVDIKGSGHSLEDFHALAIVFRTGGLEKRAKIACPMIGYSNKKASVQSQRIAENLRKVLEEDSKAMERPPRPVREVEDESEIKDKQEFNLELGDEPKKVEPEAEPELEKDPGSEETQELDLKVEERQKGKTKDIQEAVLDLKNEPKMELETESELQLKKEEEGMSESEDIEGHELQFEEELDVGDVQEPESEMKIEPEAESQRERGGEEKYEAIFGEAPEFSQSMTYWDNVKDYFTEVFKAHYRVSPFDDNMGDAKWVRVQHTSVGSHGYYPNTPYEHSYYSNHYPDHYLVGLIEEDNRMKYVVYGVPSMYSMMPPISINGFSRWVPVKDGYGMGYWLLYIDAVSGMVVHPNKRE